MHPFPVKLSPETDLLSSLHDLAIKQNSDGYILGIVGNLSSASFQCPGRNQPEVLHGNLEIITLNGTISPKGSHLHLSISDTTCRVFGGHLERGSKVLKGVDLLVGFLNDNLPETFLDLNLKPSKLLRVEIFILDNCPWSKRSVRFLDKLEIPYKVNMISSETEFQFVHNKTNSSTFPQIFIDEIYIGGYDDLMALNRTGKLEELR
tara:strand:+ start:276 stop:893 length:618 start_codon:yes stop_codon:yes gene_type:complete